MPFLIDGNNLMFALRTHAIDVGREGLCKLLMSLVRRGEWVTVVFDGPRRPGMEQHEDEIEVIYSGGKTADAIVIELIGKNSAPRRLHVVSTDRQIRTAARKRRCPALTSDEFAQMLVDLQGSRPRPKEPPEKRKGLASEEQSQQWLKVFGLDKDSQPAKGSDSGRKRGDEHKRGDDPKRSDDRGESNRPGGKNPGRRR